MSTTTQVKGSLVLDGNLSVANEAYNATTWNGNLEVPTKDAIRDKIETLGTGGTIGGSITNDQIAFGATTANSIEGSANLTFDGTTLTYTNTDAGSAAGPELDLFRNSASPAAGDYIGQVRFLGESSTGVQRTYAKITGKIGDPTNSSEDGIIEMMTRKNGSNNIAVRLNESEFKIINDTDFSVNTNILYVDSTNDRVGIGTSSPDKLLHIYGGTDTAFILVENTTTAEDAIISFKNPDRQWTIGLDGGETTFNINFSSTLGGASSTFEFGGAGTLTCSNVEVDDEAYGVGWDTSLEVPTKNALYDKIETLGGGGGMDDWVAGADSGSNLTVNDAYQLDFVGGDGIFTTASANEIEIKILADSITEAMLKLPAGPTNDYVLTADSAETGGMKWAELKLPDDSAFTLSRSVTIVDPVATDDATIFYTPVAITVTSVRSHITGTTNVVFNVSHSSTRTGTAADVFSSNITLTSTAGQNNSSGFSDATIPSGSWVWLDVVSVSGTPTMFHATIIYTED